MITRTELVSKVIKLMDLPKSKDTEGYFTKKQLMEMIIKLESGKGKK